MTWTYDHGSLATEHGSETVQRQEVIATERGVVRGTKHDSGQPYQGSINKHNW